MNGAESTPAADRQGFDVFLSYNSRDRLVVEEIARQLEARGLKPYLDRWYFVPGLRWRPGLEEVLISCQSVAVLCGPGDMGSWQQREVDVALDRQSKEAKFPVIPVLLPGAVPPLGFLRQNTWVDYNSSKPEQALAMLAKAIRGEALGHDLENQLAATRASICPYRGLLHFREEDAAFFFGRDQTIQSLTAVVRQKNFMAVVGASGSGKSSVVRAGLVPQLRRDRGITWEVVTVKPGDQPLKALATALLPFLEPQLNVREHLEEVGKYATSLLNGKIQLADVVEKLIEKQPGTNRLLLIVNQWEELYTATSDEEARRRFIDELLDASTRGRGRLTVILTLRADFMGKALAYRPLCDRLQDAQLNVGPMSRAELEQAVNRPAVDVGLSFEPGLNTRLLDDAGDEPGNLPLVEFVLDRLWKERHHGQFLHEAYDRMGGLRGAIAARAERLYSSLDSPGQAAIRSLFLQLVRPGEGEEYTRRRVPLDGSIPQSSAHLIQRLADERLLVTAKSPGGEESFEVAHEALIQHWGTLRKWLGAERDFLGWRERLRSGLEQWEEALKVKGPSSPWLPWKTSGVVKDTFLRGAILKEAEAKCEQYEAYLGATERRYIADSVAYRERSLRLKIAGLIAIALIGAVLASVASVQWLRAENERQIAVAAQLAAQAELIQGKGENRLQHAALLAVESLRRSPTVEADQVLRGALRLLPRPVLTLAHGTAVVAVAYSPGGRYLVTASRDAAQVWDVTNGVQVGQPARHTGGVNSVAFSPDGQSFATGGQDATARRWETATGREIGSAMPHTKAVAQVVFSPEGRHLATRSYDNVIRFWSTDSHKLIGAPFADQAGVNGIALGSEAKILAVAYRNGVVRLWDVATRQEIANMKHEGGEVRSVAFNQAGDLLATASEDKTARIWSATNRGTVTRPLTMVRHPQAVVAAVFSPDGQRLATASLDSSARVWDLTGRELARMIHDKAVASVAFSPDGQHLATASDDGTAKTWEVTGYSEVTKMEGSTGIAFSSDGKHFATAGPANSARVWETGTAKEVAEFVHPDVVNGVAFSPSGRLATACRDGAVRIWDPGSRQQSNRFQIGKAEALIFSKDGRYLVAQGADWAVVLRMPAGDMVAGLMLSNVSSVAISGDGRQLATVSSNTVRVLDLEGRKTVGTYTNARTFTAVSFSPDGRHLATAGWDQTARVWKTAGEPIQLKHLDNQSLLAVAFSSDGKLLATGSGDGTARVWEWSTGRELVQMTNGTRVESVEFSPDGRYLATVSVDKNANSTARLCVLPPQQLIKVACDRLTRNFTTNEWQQYFGAGPDAERRCRTCMNLP